MTAPADQAILDALAAVVALSRIRSMVEQFAEILEDPSRVREFEILAQRALGPQ